MNAGEREAETQTGGVGITGWCSICGKGNPCKGHRLSPAAAPTGERGDGEPEERGIVCAYCGEYSTYATTDDAALEVARQTMIGHDAVCPKNPLVERIRELESRVPVPAAAPTGERAAQLLEDWKEAEGEAFHAVYAVCMAPPEANDGRAVEALDQLIRTVETRVRLESARSSYQIAGEPVSEAVGQEFGRLIAERDALRDRLTTPPSAPTGERDAELVRLVSEHADAHGRLLSPWSEQRRQAELQAEAAMRAIHARVAALRQEARGDVLGTAVVNRSKPGRHLHSIQIDWHTAGREGDDIPVLLVRTPGGVDHA